MQKYVHVYKYIDVDIYECIINCICITTVCFQTNIQLIVAMFHIMLTLVRIIGTIIRIKINNRNIWSI